MSKFQDNEKIKKTNDEKYKEKLASDVVDVLLQREINTLMSNNKGKGWICGFGMENRIRCAKKKFSEYTLDELILLNDICLFSEKKQDLISLAKKHYFSYEEVKKILSKAKEDLPLIFYHPF